jgi:hypothetical protein
MRESGPARLIAYYGDYHCAQSVATYASRWADHVRSVPWENDHANN